MQLFQFADTARYFLTVKSERRCLRVVRQLLLLLLLPAACCCGVRQLCCDSHAHRISSWSEMLKLPTTLVSPLVFHADIRTQPFVYWKLCNWQGCGLRECRRYRQTARRNYTDRIIGDVPKNWTASHLYRRILRFDSSDTEYSSRYTQI